KLGRGPPLLSSAFFQWRHATAPVLLDVRRRMRASGSTVCAWWRASGATVVHVHLPAVPVHAGAAAWQRLPALWPRGNVQRPWSHLIAPQPLCGGEQLVELVGRHLRLARPADRRRIGLVAAAAGRIVCPRIVCAAAQGASVTDNNEPLL